MSKSLPPSAVSMTPGIGLGFLRRVFTSGSFLQALIELIKDGLDWGATEIHLGTTRKGCLVYADNGIGMNPDNRRAFISFNLTTARADRHQAGRQGSGTKFMLARSTCLKFATRTVDDPSSIVTFTTSIDAIERAIVEQASLEVEHTPVTPQAWPRGFATGTELVYELENARSMPRGDKLARELAERLTHAIANKVFVDGKRLPEPEVIGEKFVYETGHPMLGRIAIELTRPKNRREGDGVFFTPNDIGEASYGAFMRAAGDQNRPYFPEILSLAEVSGTISAAFLADVAVDDRTQFSDRLASDKRVRIFAAFLSELAPKIGETLGITVSRGRKEGGIDLGPIADDISGRFGGLPAVQKPPPDDGPTILPPPSGPKPPGPHKPPVRRTTGIQLVMSHSDREVGEEFVIHAYLREQALVAQGIGFSSLRIKYDDTLVRRLGPAESGDGWRFKALKVGEASFTAYVNGHADITATCSIDVVSRRRLRISPPLTRTRVGETATFAVENADRIRSGSVVWEVVPSSVPINVAPDALSATVSPNVYCEAIEVRASDPGDPVNFATATIIVPEKDAPRIRIEDTVFWLKPHEGVGVTETSVFAHFRPEGASGEGHILAVNVAHPRMLRANERGNEHIRRVFVEEVAARYAEFSMQYLHPEETKALEAEGALALLRKSHAIALSVMDKLLS